MTIKNLKILRMVLTILLGMVIGISVVKGYPVVIVITFTVVSFLLFVTKKSIRSREIIEDERLIRIAEKSARLSFTVFGLFAAVGGGVLVAIDHGKMGPFYLTGMVLSASVIILLLLQIGFYYYFQRKS